jgi:hypothetical protein
MDFNDHGFECVVCGMRPWRHDRYGSLRARSETDSLCMTTHDNGWDRVPVERESVSVERGGRLQKVNRSHMINGV